MSKFLHVVQMLNTLAAVVALTNPKQIDVMSEKQGADWANCSLRCLPSQLKKTNSCKMALKPNDAP